MNGVHLQCHTDGITAMHGCHRRTLVSCQGGPQGMDSLVRGQEGAEIMKPARSVSCPTATTCKLCDLRQVT